MKLILWIVGLAAAVVVGVHGYFYAMAGTVDPCKAAVTRLIQKQRTQGSDIVASVGVLLSEQLEDTMRSEGVEACYRTALTGKAPEVVIRLDKGGLHTGGR